MSRSIKDAGHDTKALFLPDKDWIQKIKDYAPDVVAYSVTTGMHLYFCDINKKLKQELPNVYSIIGGPHATYTPPAGFADSFATAISFSLQHGVELRFLVDKFTHVRFEPSGFTGNPDIPIAKSIVDYVFRWLAKEFLPEDEQPGTPALQTNDNDLESDTTAADPKVTLAARERATYRLQADAPPCHECGEIMVRNGACYACANCGATSGCS